MDLADPADDALLDHRLGGELRLVGGDLNPHLRGNTVLARGERQRSRLADRNRERLLHVDRLPHRHRRHRDWRVHVIGRRHVERVDLGALLSEHLAPVLVHARIREEGLDLCRTGQVRVGHRDEREVRMARERADVRQRLTGRPDARMPDLPALSAQACPGPRRESRGAAEALQEPPA
jgi:hypothetical protein